MRKYLYISILLSISSHLLRAQTHTISGSVLDASSMQPINISFFIRLGGLKVNKKGKNRNSAPKIRCGSEPCNTPIGGFLWSEGRIAVECFAIQCKTITLQHEEQNWNTHGRGVVGVCGGAPSSLSRPPQPKGGLAGTSAQERAADDR